MTGVAGDFSNTTVRRFHISRLIARGGMGEVYLATDAVLGRDLALKILRQDVTRDTDRLERFIQEARAASALNHPHLISIYDIGVSSPKRQGVAVVPPLLYIAMELVTGETLRAAIEAKRLGLDELLTYMAQVADALAAAHAAGVVHRDLKPENLMIAEDGYAKVLDFGVAKLRDEITQGMADGGGEPGVHTDGMLLGTVGYMSPEQVQGRPVDHRSDVFSFGCVLYEAISGSRAFSGANPVEMLKGIVFDEPPPLADRPGLPPSLQATVRKCLAKAPEQRYQSMREVAADLREIRRGLAAAQGRDVGRASWRRVLVGMVALLAVAAAVRWSMGDRERAATSADVTIERLTASGTAIDAAISPDGNRMAWVESSGGLQSLRIRQLAELTSVELVPPALVGYWGIAFSRDGASVLYATKSADSPAGRLFSVAVAGGTPRLLLEGIDSTVTFSPDGRRMAFYRAGYPERGATALVTAAADGSDARVLAETRPPELFVPAFFAAPSWSPDGTRIAAAVHNSDTGDAHLVTIETETGARASFPHRFGDATFTAWLPDGSGILFVASQAEAIREVPRKVWLQPYPRGEPRRITPDLLEYRNISVRSDGTAFVAVGLDAVYTLWRVPLDGGNLQRIASERYDGLLGIAPLRDGRVVVTAGERGNPQLAVLDRTGGIRRMLTREGMNLWPAAAPDGRTIAFVSNRDGQTGIWRMSVEGGEARLLAHLPNPSWLSVTPDGRHVVCASLTGAERGAWRVPMDGGAPTLIAAGIDRPAVSPDGRWLAGINVTPGAAPLTLVVMPIDGGPIRVLGTIAPATANGLLDWTARGDGILYSTVERANVWLHPIAGGPPRRITNLTDLGIVRGRRAADGTSLIVARGVAQTDAYLIANFR